MKVGGKGHIVNITSTWERRCYKGVAVYCGSKHFWTSESRAAAVYFMSVLRQLYDIFKQLVTEILSENYSIRDISSRRAKFVFTQFTLGNIINFWILNNLLAVYASILCIVLKLVFLNTFP